ncbi:uncharacterized protein LOC123302954 [Chrysoperla carnea]|uniref:uncharacterized protein LOC123302954 n=1 Tax=Chrysoperla carnea TaxID=189513 RepID=UPI001D08F1E9|nr:uncharacterized protein LOC123302954 [Chrysoperla carnea]
MENNAVIDGNDFKRRNNSFKELLKQHIMAKYEESITLKKQLKQEIDDEINIIDEYSERCLLCKRKVDGNNLDEHILGKKHQKNLDDVLKITALDSFHAGWSNIPISLRLTNEILFLPHSENEIECCICNKNINYRELIAHVETHQGIPGEFILLEMVSNNPIDEELLNTRSGLINQVQIGNARDAAIWLIEDLYPHECRLFELVYLITFTPDNYYCRAKEIAQQLVEDAIQQIIESFVCFFSFL